MASTVSLYKQRVDESIGLVQDMDMYKGLNYIFWFYDMYLYYVSNNNDNC